MRVETLAPHAIRTDGGTQMRPHLNREVVGEYEEAMTEGRWDWEHHPLPVVFHDGAVHWLADGEHRLTACQTTATPFRTEVREGSLADAIWYGTSANRDHGLRRTNDAKRNAVATALGHLLGRTMTDRALAEHCGVSHTFVGNVRRELGQAPQPGAKVERVDKQGRKINVARIGRGSPITQIDKWWKQAPTSDKKAVYERIALLYQREFTPQTATA